MGVLGYVLLNNILSESSGVPGSAPYLRGTGVPGLIRSKSSDVSGSILHSQGTSVLSLILSKAQMFSALSESGLFSISP